MIDDALSILGPLALIGLLLIIAIELFPNGICP